MTKKFKYYADNINIIVNIISIKAHYSIEIIECYYGSLRRIYIIIILKISNIKENLALQIIFKTFNDSIKSNDLMLTLLIFGAYL